MQPLGVFALALGLAAFVEGMTEYVFAPFLDKLKEWLDFPVIQYVALGIGLLIAFAYRLDLIWELLGYRAVQPWVGIAISGLLVGRGANYLHEFAQKYLGVP